MGDVIDGRFITTHKLSPDRMMERAAEYGLEDVVIIGQKPDGEMFFAASYSDSRDIIYWLEKAKYELLKMEDRIRENGDPRGKPGRGA